MMRSILVLCALVALLGRVASGDTLKFIPNENDVIKFLGNAAGKIPEFINGLPTSPKFCRKLGCPKYKVIETDKEYELREYEVTHWVSTNMVGMDFDAAEYTMFMKLFKYIQGNNVKSQKIEMTTPVKVRILPGPGPTCESNFTMSFFMDPKIGAPPTPTDTTLRVDSMPGMRAYVRSFSGFASLKDWLEEAVALSKALPAAAKYETDYYYTAGYDAPYQIFSRHNEVWFLAQ